MHLLLPYWFSLVCIGTCRYYVTNPAAKKGGWFSFHSSAAQPTLDPGFAAQQSVLKSSQHLTTSQQIHVTAKGGPAPSRFSRQNGRLSHDAEQGRRTSDEVQGLGVATVQQPQELELLKGVSGYAVPGKLMALMGGSGAGEQLISHLLCR